MRVLMAADTFFDTFLLYSSPFFLFLSFFSVSHRSFFFFFFFFLGRVGHSGGVQEDDVAPSAPPLDHMDQVFGYEATSFDAGNSMDSLANWHSLFTN